MNSVTMQSFCLSFPRACPARVRNPGREGDCRRKNRDFLRLRSGQAFARQPRARMTERIDNRAEGRRGSGNTKRSQIRKLPRVATHRVCGSHNQQDCRRTTWSDPRKIPNGPKPRKSQPRTRENWSIRILSKCLRHDVNRALKKTKRSRIRIMRSLTPEPCRNSY
jgi:hypothetical protein